MTLRDDRKRYSGDPVAHTVERILELLDEENMRRTIDGPVDTAVASFHVESTTPVSHHRFHQVIGEFTQHVYRSGVRVSRELSPTQAAAEAIFLLENGYRSAQSDGYDAALLDAMNPQTDGIRWVLAHLADIIKEKERGKYTSWVFATTLGSLDWSAKCRLAQVLLDQLSPCLVPQLRRCTGAQLVDEIPALLTTDLSTDAWLRRLPGAGATLGSP